MPPSSAGRAPRASSTVSHDVDAYEEVLARRAGPGPASSTTAGLEGVAATFGDLVDLKSPWLRGHSAGVAALAADAESRIVGLPDDVATVRVAGHLHDLGRVGVSTRIWDKPGRLSQGASGIRPGCTRTTASASSRGSPALAEVGRIAGQHHERCDGTGYHRGVTASPPDHAVQGAGRRGRVPEPGRGAGPTARRRPPRTRPGTGCAARSGPATSTGTRWRPSCQAAGQARRRPPGPTRPVLTERQVEVLRLMAEGAVQPGGRPSGSGSPGSTAEHHVQDVYVKIGASTRAAAALYAMEHSLVDRPG